MNLKAKLNAQVKTMLETSGLSWDIEGGKKHHQLRINGRLVAVLPQNGKWDRPGRDTQNLMRQVRHMIINLKGGVK